MYIKINVPEEIESVTSYKPEDEVDPADAGMSKRGVESIWSAVEGLYRTGIHPAISFCCHAFPGTVVKGRIRKYSFVLINTNTIMIL